MGLQRYEIRPNLSGELMRVFGFAASLLERMPIIGLFLSISNRIGAAMWWVKRSFTLRNRN